MGEEWGKSTTKYMQTFQAYIKCQFSLELDVSNTCASHCLERGLSDPKKKCFAKKCHHDHSETCERCQMGEVMFMHLHGAIEECTPLLSEVQVKEYLFDVTRWAIVRL